MASAPHPISRAEYREILGSSDEKNSNESGNNSSVESDIDFTGLESPSKSEIGRRKFGGKRRWNRFDNLAVNDFTTALGIKVATHNEAKVTIFLNLIFEDSVIDLAVQETNRN